MLAAAAILLGISIGLISGGDVGSLKHVEVRHSTLLICLFIVQGASRGRLPFTTTTPDWVIPVWAVTSLAVVAIAALNLHSPGMVLAAAGVMLNLDVVLMNGAMPLAAPTGGALPVAGEAFYRLATPSMFAWHLGDVIPLSLAGSVYLVSVGDVLLAVAVAIFIVAGMRSTPEATESP